MPKENVIKKTPNAPTALIAGGAGFLGSHLAEFLLLKDARVIVLDNFTTGKDVYINSLMKNPKFAVFDVDINQGIPKEIQSVDYIVHLAGIETYLSNSDNVDLDSLLTNAVGTKALLDLAKKSEAKFLLGSSINVYQGLMSSINLENYFGETEEEEKRYSLAEAKRFAEALVWEYHKKNETNARIVRLPEVFGPRMNLNSTGNLGRLLKNLMENEDLVVFGEGTEKEYYLYITDAVAGIAKALFNENTSGKIFTVADSEAHAVLETAYLLKSVADRELNVKFKPKSSKVSPRESKVTDLDSMRELNWSPKISYKEGLIKTLKWFGYEVNTNSFKLKKIIDEKDKTVQKAQVMTIASKKPAETEKVRKKKNLFSFFKKVFKPKKKVQRETPKLEFKAREINQPKETLTGLVDHEALKKSEPKPELTERYAPKEPMTPVSKPLGLSPVIPDKSVKHKALSKLKGIKLPRVNKQVVLGVIAALIGFLVVMLIVPGVQLYTNAKGAQSELNSYVEGLSNLDSERARYSADEAFKKLVATQNSLKSLKWAFVLSGRRAQYEALQKTLDSGKFFSRTIYNAAKATDPFFEVWGAMETNSEASFDQTNLHNAKNDLIRARENLQFAVAELMQINLNNLPAQIKDEVMLYDQALLTMSNGLDVAIALSTELPNIMGAEETKRYLILLQNSNEIRPTGGFIGSYAVLEINKGKIAKLVIDDIYNPDGQIDIKSIEVTSPDPIKEYLQEENLHIRNANWNPDFAESVKDIEDLFYKVDGSAFHGVMAIDLFFAQKLLEVTGPVFLTAYNQEVNAQNMYEVIQHHSEFRFEPGSSQKRSFLTIFGSKLLEKLVALDSEKLPTLVRVLGESLEEKHLLMYLPNSSFNEALRNRDWTGELIETDGDYLYVVDANLGGTKSNYYVNDSMSYNILSQTRDGLLRAELYLDYEHTGEDEAWPGGPYTDYVRVLVKEGAKLTDAQLIRNGQIEKSIFEEIKVEKVGKYTSFGTGFTVNPQEKVTIVLKYDLSENLSISTSFKEYRLLWQKQPGTQGEKYNVLFSAPFGVEIDYAKPQTTVKENSVEYSGELNTNMLFDIKLK